MDPKSVYYRSAPLPPDAERVQWQRHGAQAPQEWLRWVVAGTLGGIIPVQE